MAEWLAGVIVLGWMTLHLPSRRTEQQRVGDLLLVLCAAARTAALGATPGDVVTQKIFFAAKRHGRATHHDFIRYTFGPFSPELRDDRAWLVSAGLLHASRFTPTPRGLEVARHWRHLLAPENKAIFTALEQSVNKRAKWSGKQAMAEAYAVQFLRADGSKVSLADLPQLTPISLSALDLEMSDGDAADLLVDLSLSPSDIAAMTSPRRPRVSIEQALEALGA